MLTTRITTYDIQSVLFPLWRKFKFTKKGKKVVGNLTFLLRSRKKMITKIIYFSVEEIITFLKFFILFDSKWSISWNQLWHDPLISRSWGWDVFLESVEVKWAWVFFLSVFHIDIAKEWVLNGKKVKTLEKPFRLTFHPVYDLTSSYRT